MKKRIIKKLKHRFCKKFDKKDKSFNKLMQVGSRQYKQKFTETILALATVESPYDGAYLHRIIDEEYTNMKKRWGRRMFSAPVEDAEEWVSCWNS